MFGRKKKNTQIEKPNKFRIKMKIDEKNKMNKKKE